MGRDIKESFKRNRSINKLIKRRNVRKSPKVRADKSTGRAEDILLSGSQKEIVIINNQILIQRNYYIQSNNFRGPQQTP